MPYDPTYTIPESGSGQSWRSSYTVPLPELPPGISPETAPGFDPYAGYKQSEGGAGFQGYFGAPSYRWGQSADSPMLYWDNAGGNLAGYKSPGQWRETTIGSEDNFLNFARQPFIGSVLSALGAYGASAAFASAFPAAAGALGAGASGAGAAGGGAGAGLGMTGGYLGAGAESGAGAGMAGAGAEAASSGVGPWAGATQYNAPSYWDRLLGYVKAHPFEATSKGLSGANTIYGLAQKMSANPGAAQAGSSLSPEALVGQQLPGTQTPPGQQSAGNRQTLADLQAQGLGGASPFFVAQMMGWDPASGVSAEEFVRQARQTANG